MTPKKCQMCCNIKSPHRQCCEDHFEHLKMFLGHVEPEIEVKLKSNFQSHGFLANMALSAVGTLYRHKTS